ncbi:MAG: nitroreductase/quinone reductase family protein [Acidimicrobiales bacterium]
MRAKESLVDVGFKALNVFHRSVISLSRGRIGRSAFGMPVVELRTMGRVSGRTRSVILTAPIIDEGRVVLVASKGGDDRDPEWYRNILVHPDVELVIAGERHRMRARNATKEERDELWPRVVSVYRHYNTYQRRAHREIPVVICEP